MNPFLRVLKPTVICNGIRVSPLLILDSAEHSTKKGLCKLVYRHETWHRCRYSDFIPVSPLWTLDHTKHGDTEKGLYQ